MANLNEQSDCPACGHVGLDRKGLHGVPALHLRVHPGRPAGPRPRGHRGLYQALRGRGMPLR